ncbi:mitotic checkpoint protein BUB3-like [Oscarella lobularis]|uniref:mitotic checkpoint protein BUB3-like n=1 Tax=Oscarella lobularis TaxID=121494 RepID=UPI0033142CFF
MAEMEGPNESELLSPPADGITSVAFSPTSNFLLVSSWDKSVRLYDPVTNTLRVQHHHAGAVLDCCFSDTLHSFSGGLDKTLKTFNYADNVEDVLGTHDDAIRCVEYCPSSGLIATGSWDKTVKLWDTRSKTCVTTMNQLEKVYTMAVNGDKLIVGTKGRRVMIWDLRDPSKVEARRESTLKYETRCIRCFPNGQGYVLSSIEGRVAVEFFAPEAQKSKYAFKCHRTKESGVEVIYPVTAISFHPVHSTFATGGCDNLVNIWDAFNRKRLAQFHRYPSSISSLCFNCDGSMLAIASSYMMEDGEKENTPRNSVFIRYVSDLETKPK